MDLRHSLIPDELVEELTKSMPEHSGPDLEQDRELPKYDYIRFMESLLGASETNGHASTSRSASPTKK